jgi:hypothetical protein
MNDQVVFRNRGELSIMAKLDPATCFIHFVVREKFIRLKKNRPWTQNTAYSE